MNDRCKWYFYYIKNYLKRYFMYRIAQLRGLRSGESLFYGKANMDKTWKIARKKQLNIQEANIVLAEAINSKKAFWAGRFGGMERDMIIAYLEEINNLPNDKEKRIKGLCNNAGFFPMDEKLADQFSKLMLSICGEIDLLGAWPFGFMEDYLVSNYMVKSCVTRMAYLEPWSLAQSKYRGRVKPWTHALMGKRVLVVHPFVETIKQQYLEKRTKIFEGKFESEDILPEFELITLKAVQTQGGEKDERFDDWFEALEWLKCECSRLEFDVAIVGCGAYGFPLAAHIKSLGKVAIHMGGATQLLFGIKGKRWEQVKEMQDIFNDNWVRPAEFEKISNAAAIEDSCYW